MAISSGTLIGRYEVLTKLGVGGMGVVYKAHDTQLDRPVALKILPPELVRDQDRVRRFVQEAKSASALNHPHIVTIYEIGHEVFGEGAASADEKDAQPTNGDPEPVARPVHYIAMEFINGDTLRAKINRDKTDLKRLLELLIQVAEGLAKAHTFSIVHRDLKPENIMITEDGYAKVLDFGLAKLIEADKLAGGDDMLEAETVMMSRTLPGMVIGTVGYMSPEQVQGKTVDQRSDIFSFGCILYEAATGRKPFDGDSLIDSLHKIVYAPAPPIKEINPDIPAELQRIIRKCLSKAPDERYQSIKDIALDLRDLIKEYDSLPSVSTTYPPLASANHSFASGSQSAVASGAVSGVIQPPPRRARWWVAAGVGAFIVVAIAFALFKLAGRKSRDANPAMPFQTMKVTRLTSNGRSSGAIISPDGKYVVHFISEAGKKSLWVRQVATSSNVEIIPPAEVVYTGATFSNDGNFVYFVKLESKLIGVLYQIPVLGGNPKKIIEDVDTPISFSPDGTRFVFQRGVLNPAESRLIIANADGTGERVLAARKVPQVYALPAWSPDGRTIACSVGDGSQMSVVEVRVADGAEKPITAEKWPLVGKVGWFADNSGLAIIAADQTSRQRQIWHLSYPGGETRRITNDLNDYGGMSLTADGKTLAVTQSDAITNLWLAPRSDLGRARQITFGASKYSQLTWTPDGRIVYCVTGSGSGDIWIMDANGGNQKQLISNVGVNVFPAVSPDGRYIVFASNRGSASNILNIWRINSDGSDPKQLTYGNGELGCSITPDGKWVVYSSIESFGEQKLWKVSIDGGEPVQLSDKTTALPAVSPDGKLVACTYWEELLESPFVIGVVPIEGGPPAKTFKLPQGPVRWTPDGSAITYINDQNGVSNIWMQPLAGGAPKQLTDFKSDRIYHFDWSRDGKQLAVSRGITTSDVVLISNVR
ncbi:MAG TPA: protein kinase [Blastocatellia bacterium]|nr:protein kinase [Blastocatellia bacterium]